MTENPHFQLFIDGVWTEGSDGQVMSSLNPATGQDWATFACSAPSDVDRAVSAARRALGDPAWRDMTQTRRGKLLFRLAELIEQMVPCAEMIAFGKNGSDAVTAAQVLVDLDHLPLGADADRLDLGRGLEMKWHCQI